MTKNIDEERIYWDRYYADRNIGGIPSQFAAFIANEYRDHERLIDIGCGNGRDSFFFASVGKKVLGADGSIVAVEACRAAAQERGVKNLGFQHLDVASQTSCRDFLTQNLGDWSGALIYARFFVHAINETEETQFIDLCRRLAGTGGKVCLEFRTDRDAKQRKVTEHHYRRFIRSVEFMRAIHQHGLNVDYFCEGFGLAKHRADDAHVARFVVSA